MKFLKWLGIFFLSLFSFIFILLLSLSLITKNVIQKGVVGSVIRNVIVEEFASDEELSKEDKENIEKVNKVIKTNDINELVTRLLDEYEERINDDDTEVSDETVDFVIDLLVDYKDLINDITNENVTEKQIRSKDTRAGIKDALNEVISETPENKELAVKIIITSYTVFISTTFRLVMVILTLLCFALIGLIKKSFITWMKPASIVLVITGVLITAMYFGLLYGFNAINTETDLTFVIEPTTVIIGIVEIILGIIMRIVTIVTGGKKDKE